MARARMLSATLVALLTACQTTSQAVAPPAGPAAQSVVPTARRVVFESPSAGEPPPVATAPPELAVLDHAPVGRTDPEAVIHLRFNQPVVALGDPLLAEGGVRLVVSPKIEGRCVWSSPDRLVFEPGSWDGSAQKTFVPTPWPEAQRWTVRLEALPGATSTAARLAQSSPLSWTFETPGLQVLASEPDGDTGEWEQQQVLIQFSQPVSLRRLPEFIQARASRPEQESPSPLPVRIDALSKRAAEKALFGAGEFLPGTIVRLRPTRRWPAASTITVAIGAGLQGRKGPVPMAKDWEISFKTPGPLTIASMKCYDDPCSDGPINLTLSSRVTKSQLRHLNVSPHPRHLRVTLDDDDGYEPGGREISIDGDFLAGKTYTVILHPQMRSVFGWTVGEGTNGQPLSRSLPVAVPTPSLLGLSNPGIFPPDQAPIVGIETHKVRTLTVATVALDAHQAAQVLLGKVDKDKPLESFKESATTRQIVLETTGPTAWSDRALDLRDLLGADWSAALVEVHAQSMIDGKTPLPKPVWQLYRKTGLGPVVFQSMPRTLVKVVRLSDAQPLAGARVSIVGKGAAILLGQTDGQGLLLSEAREFPPGDSALVATSPNGKDFAILKMPGHENPPTEGLNPGEWVLLGMMSERRVYRPGETINLVGWGMVNTPYAQTNLRALPAGTPAQITAVDSQGKEFAHQATVLDAGGKFSTKLPVPSDTALGLVGIQVKVQKASSDWDVRLEDFRTPEFEVKLNPVHDAIVGDEPAQLALTASHYSGVPVTLSHLAYSVDCKEWHSPLPNLEHGWEVSDFHGWHGRQAPTEVEQANGQRGSVGFTASLPPADGQPANCFVYAEAQDASLQATGAKASIGVHPARFYLALLPPQEPIFEGDRLAIPVRAYDTEGRRQAASDVTVRLTRHFTEEVQTTRLGRKHVEVKEKETVAATCRLDLAADKDGSCALGKGKQGRYTVLATATEGSHKVRTRSEFHIWGRPTEPPEIQPAPQSPPDEKGITTRMADGSATHEPVKPGERVAVTVHSPCLATGGQLLLERGGIREQYPFVLTDRKATLELVARDWWVPSVSLQASIICPADKDNFAKVEQSTGSIWMGAAPRDLQVEVSVPARARPGQSIPVQIAVKDGQGKAPANGHVALWAVDEAVLRLTGYQAPNPLGWFVPWRGEETSTLHGFEDFIRSHVPRSDPGDMLGSLRGRCARSPDIIPGCANVSIKSTRALFVTTPIFLADLALGADGRAAVSIKLPDDLTTFRITAMASAPLEDGKTPGRFGSGEALTQVTSPFILRPALPRLLRPGDSAEIAAIVHNQSGVDGRVIVEASVDQGEFLAITGATQAGTTLAAGMQARLAFQVSALRAGVAQVELRGRLQTSGEPYLDAVRLPVPVQVEPSLLERSAMLGTLDSDQAIAVEARFPVPHAASVGGISVNVSDSLLGELQDALAYLVDYPYGCIEQTSSRVLALVAARQLGRHFALPLSEPEARLAAAIERIASMQTKQGGFAYWPGEKKVHPYASAFATWTLLQARANGVALPQGLLQRALDYLEKSLSSAAAPQESHLREPERAITLAVLAEAGRTLPAEDLTAAFVARDSLPVFARTLLLGALHRMGDNRSRTMMDELLGSFSELPATAHVREQRALDLEPYFHSESRTDAMALLALMQVQPDHAVVPKLVRGLLERRAGGRWRNTQENAYAVLAVMAYAKRFEAQAPQFTALAWVGPRPILNATFGLPPAGPTFAFAPMSQVAADKPVPVVLQRRGQGRLYWRLGTEWQSTVDPLPAREQGLTIERLLRTRTTSSTDKVAAGEAVAFDITIKNRTSVSYVAINIPVPAGLEPVLEDLGQGHRASLLSGEATSWTHQEKHPDRVLLFADLLPPGIHRQTIQLRATTPGRYTLPPARAEAMYAPEVYGRTTSSTLTVE